MDINFKYNSLYILIQKFYLVNSTNIEVPPVGQELFKYSGWINKESRPKKKKNEEGERTKTKTLYFGVSNSDFRSKLSNTFRGFCAPLDYFRLPGFAEEKWDFTIWNFLAYKAMRICTAD